MAVAMKQKLHFPIRYPRILALCLRKSLSREVSSDHYTAACQACRQVLALTGMEKQGEALNGIPANHHD
jgi:hypothetical protein